MEEKKSSKGLIIGIIVVVVIGIFVWRYFSSKNVPSEQVGEEQQVAGMEDSIFVANQKPGRFVNVGRATLSKKGYVAIHQEEAGAPGAIIGFGSLLNVGETKNLSVTLNRKSVAGESFYAMIHWDNNNGAFNPSEDAAATDKDGNIVMAKFMISESASEPIEYKL
ncbi:MAG: hypothetical protein UW84_C0046G0002 [Candidatus Collierbacteria bacterium GW2011_GWA2_44_99]|uniref:DUF7282 domain-containing protein n=1 Tax=Candidatus Collierbacteria bacterium GW2011_GWA2_44_99 TaxID=1618380 RepID=A0A0G1KMW1_9BACT|nr:MAG: hypothetical protein UW84_C0046G0002 [Candidatus Collierbacteria bacterium GW2011_GWA2_44_99]